MASTAKPTSIADRTGRRPREEMGVIEIDATFGRMLGLADGQRVGKYGSCGIHKLSYGTGWNRATFGPSVGVYRTH
jgi:hypothetical protein